jgi:hypothetical protein
MLTNTPFPNFIKTNRIYLIIAAAGLILQFIIFKLLYPYADFFSDSYSYLYAAYANLDINIWPIGYSKFLMVFHKITSSDTALIGFQYFFLGIAALLFFYTILYFYNPAKSTIIILFIFLFFNPLTLYICNYVNSDSLFAALSLLWITQLIWIIHRPRLYQVFTHALLLYACFTVRNNAMYYPFISALAFVLSTQRIWIKATGIILGSALVLIFINNQRNAAYAITGKHQYSLFTGWQLANNALYMYKQIEVDSTQLPSEASRDLDHITKQFFKNTPPDMQDILSEYVANFFIRQSEAPLKQYYKQHFKPADRYNVAADWGKASIVFEEYGSYLIRHYPLAFARYYMLTNAKNYCLPPLEKLEVYNLGRDSVDPIAQYWFDYKSKKVTAVSATIQGKILFPFTPLFLVMNILFIICIIAKKPNNKILILITAFLAINFAFSVFATINVLRYQFFPMIVCFTFTLLLIEWMDNKTKFKQQFVATPDNNAHAAHQ